MLVGSFAFAINTVKKDLKFSTYKIENTISDSYQINSDIITQLFDHCTVTVSIYQDGELVSSATWTDYDGNCELAAAGARMMAFSLLEEGGTN